MAAKDYILAVTPLTNTVWICKPSKRDEDCMTNDRVAVPKNTYIGTLLQWVDNQLEADSDTLNITINGEVVAEIKIHREKLGL